MPKEERIFSIDAPFLSIRSIVRIVSATASKMLRYATESNKKVLHCCRTFVMKYF
jgi:hypothetical protein